LYTLTELFRYDRFTCSIITNRNHLLNHRALMNYSMKNTKQELLNALATNDVTELKEQRTILVWLLFIFTAIGFMF